MPLQKKKKPTNKQDREPRRSKQNTDGQGPTRPGPKTSVGRRKSAKDKR